MVFREQSSDTPILLEALNKSLAWPMLCVNMTARGLHRGHLWLRFRVRLAFDWGLGEAHALPGVGGRHPTL